MNICTNSKNTGIKMNEICYCIFAYAVLNIWYSPSVFAIAHEYSPSKNAKRMKCIKRKYI
ncbi:hypothetical protein [Clostridium haemolyticum]|uniref:hypothetical protein n=1 Tax=Clostridium haemolyticum TaxID=84025 RepID=UPI00058002B2|nr:hypothetical protein [Clostridium haemolyticum]